VAVGESRGAVVRERGEDLEMVTVVWKGGERAATRARRGSVVRCWGVTVRVTRAERGGEVGRHG